MCAPISPQSVARVQHDSTPLPGKQVRSMVKIDAEDFGGLICVTCRICYPIRDGIALMLVDDTTPI